MRYFIHRGPMQAEQGAKLERAGAVTLGDLDRSREGLLALDRQTVDGR